MEHADRPSSGLARFWPLARRQPVATAQTPWVPETVPPRANPAWQADPTALPQQPPAARSHATGSDSSAATAAASNTAPLNAADLRLGQEVRDRVRAELGRWGLDAHNHALTVLPVPGTSADVEQGRIVYLVLVRLNPGHGHVLQDGQVIEGQVLAACAGLAQARVSHVFWRLGRDPKDAGRLAAPAAAQAAHAQAQPNVPPEQKEPAAAARPKGPSWQDTQVEDEDDVDTEVPSMPVPLNAASQPPVTPRPGGVRSADATEWADTVPCMWTDDMADAAPASRSTHGLIRL